MAKYTFVVEFRGGTYISQVDADDALAALFLWGKNLTTNKIKHLGELSQTELMREIASKDYSLSLLNGVNNVWCTSFCLKKGFLLINIVG